MIRMGLSGLRGTAPGPSGAPIDPNTGEPERARRSDIVIQALGDVQDTNSRKVEPAQDLVEVSLGWFVAAHLLGGNDLGEVDP